MLCHFCVFVCSLCSKIFFVTLIFVSGSSHQTPRLKLLVQVLFRKVLNIDYLIRIISRNAMNTDSNKEGHNNHKAHVNSYFSLFDKNTYTYDMKRNVLSSTFLDYKIWISRNFMLIFWTFFTQNRLIFVPLLRTISI